MATLNVRNIDEAAVARLKRAAAARGLSLGPYLDLLSRLHDIARARADAGDDALQAEMETLGLATVRG
jgi:hypothetical protein